MFFLRKATALLLCLLLCSASLFACGEENETETHEHTQESGTATEPTAVPTESKSESDGTTNVETVIPTDTEAETEVPTDAQTAVTTEDVTEAPTESESQSEVVTEAPTESQSQSEEVTEAPTEGETESATEHQHSYEKEWQTDESDHWKLPTCGCKPAKEPHKDGDRNGLCDTCTYALCTHTYTSDYVSTKTHHWRATVCDCFVYEEPEMHKDEDRNGTCDVCSYVICTHPKAETYTQTETHHYRAYTCACPISPDPIPHTDENKDGLCDECSYVICSHEERSATEYSYNKQAHWLTLLCGCVTVPEDAEAHADEDGNDICDICQRILFKFSQTAVVENDEYTSSAFRQFNEKFDASFLIPALAEGMVPQGMDVWDEEEILLISGYFKSTAMHPTSVIVAIDLKTGAYIGEYSLYFEDGSACSSHVGGIAVSERNLYVSYSYGVLRYPLSQIEEAGYVGDLVAADYVKTPIGSSYCNYSGGYLWVGNFYIANNATYGTTPEWAVMTHTNGSTYGAACVGYKLTDETESGIKEEAWNETTEYAIPDLVFSLSQKIQGFTVMSDGTVVLSQSYGRTANSKIILYDRYMQTEMEEPHATVTLGGIDVPVYYLDDSFSYTAYTSLPMSEGLAVYGDTLLVLYESGASAYKDDGGKNPTDNVWIYTK